MPQQFVVPQFIDIESKIFGPITMRQFVIILSAFFLEFIVYKLSDFSLFIILSVFIVVITGAVAFIKVNGLPIHDFVLNFIQRLKRPTIRVWDKSDEDIQLSKETAIAIELEKIVHKTPMGGSRLAELSLIVDTGGVYQGEDVLTTKHNQNQKKKKVIKN